MLRLDLGMAISGFLFLVIALVFFHWLTYTFFRQYGSGQDQLKHFKRCPYCTHIFFDYRRQPIQTCPRCKSLLTPHEGQGRVPPR